MCCIETFLEAPIRNLAANDTVTCGSYIISNRGMEHMAMYSEGERRRQANARNQLVNLPVSQCSYKGRGRWPYCTTQSTDLHCQHHGLVVHA